MKSQDDVIRGRSFLQKELRSLRRIDEIRIEDVEFISLHNFWRRVVVIVVSLIVFVPLISRANSIVILGLARSILVSPPVRLH